MGTISTSSSRERAICGIGVVFKADFGVGASGSSIRANEIVALMSEAKQMLLRQTADGLITFVSQGCSTLLDYEPSQLCGQGRRKFFLEQELGRHSCLLQ